MKTGSLGRMVEKFHKSTILMAEKLVGENVEKFLTFPFVARVGAQYVLFMPGQDQKTADLDYLHPYVVNAGLTLELKLKHLLSVEKGKSMREHSLIRLYSALGEETKTFLSNQIAFRVEGSTAHKAISDTARSSLNFDVSWDIEFLLDKSAYAFEKWRYLYEEDNSGSWFMGYIEIYEALDQRIKSA